MGSTNAIGPHSKLPATLLGGCYTNFPAYKIPNPELFLTGDYQADLEAIAWAISDFLETQGKTGRILKLDYQLTIEGHDIQVPLVLDIENRKYCVFFIYDESEVWQLQHTKSLLRKKFAFHYLYVSKLPIRDRRLAL